MINRHGLGLGLIGALALAACSSDDGSISGVVPGDVFAGRTANVLISGDNTAWGEGGVDVAFGPGIEVGDAIVASPTAIYVSITVAPDATLGPRDVTVDGMTYEQAFSVISPLQVLSVQGTLAQGSISLVTVQSLDFTTPFDTAEGAIEVVVPEGLHALPGAAEPYQFSFTLLADVDAPSGATDLEVISGPAGGDALSFALPGGLEVLARTATTVAPDAIEGTFGAAGDSQLFKLEPSSPLIVDAFAVADSPDGALAFYVLGPDGSFDPSAILAIGQPGFFDPSSAATFVAPGEIYVVASDISGVGEYAYSIETLSAEVGSTKEVEKTGGNNGKAGAQLVVAPLAIDSALSDDKDQDWYKVVIGEADAGSSLALATYGDAPTDTVINVFEADGTTSVLGGEVDVSIHEVAFTPALEAGTYYVRILNTWEYVDLGFLPSPGPYTLGIGLAD